MGAGRTPVSPQRMTLVWLVPSNRAISPERMYFPWLFDIRMLLPVAFARFRVSIGTLAQRRIRSNVTFPGISKKIPIRIILTFAGSYFDTLFVSFCYVTCYVNNRPATVWQPDDNRAAQKEA